jgi:hypothetical protein
MKPTSQAGNRLLLTAADNARIRTLSIERARIVARLRQLEEMELAASLYPQFPELSGLPIAARRFIE